MDGSQRNGRNQRLSPEQPKSRTDSALNAIRDSNGSNHASGLNDGSGGVADADATPHSRCGPDKSFD